VLVDFAFLTGVVLLGITLVGDLQNKWNSKYYDLTKQRIEDAYNVFENQLKQWGVHRQENAPRAIPVEGAEPAEPPASIFPAVETSKLRELVERNLEALRTVDFERAWSFGTDVVGRVVGFFGTALVVFILTVFMLTEARMFGRRFTAICDARGPNFQRMLSATRDIQRYLGIKTAVSLATGVLAGLLCWAAGLDFFLLWGILAFVLNFIPVVGSVIAGVPPTLLALLVAGLPSGIAVAGGYILINVLLGNFIEPMLMGRRFGLSTLVVVVSVLFWGWLWGVLGMLLAVPLTMMLKVVLDNSEEFRWIAVAISKEQRRPAEEQRILEAGAGLDQARPLEDPGLHGSG
jgi:AI-2 transport protein TqsA